MKSERVSKINISPTIKIAAKAIMMKREKIDVVDLSVGEPDFPTPQFIKDAAKKAIDENLTKYTLNKGLYELREAIAERLKEDQRLEYHPEEIIVSNGAKHSLLNIIMATVNPGDEVIIPAPYWVSYPEMVQLADGRPVIINALEKNGFKLMPDQLHDAISASTRALILCNPSNPTGMAYSKDELEALAEVIEREDILVIADEIYEKLTFDTFRFFSFAAINKAMKQRTIVINGVSKAYAMTGWRIGYAAGDREIIESANIIQSHSTSNASTISQHASLAAFKGPQYEITRMCAEFERRRNFILHKLEQIPGISCQHPQGAFYVFPNVSSFYGKQYEGTIIRNSYGLAYYLLRQAHVALIPGAAFGADENIRISYASSLENLERGMIRITDALGKLKTPVRERKVRLNNYQTRVRNDISRDTYITMDKRHALVGEAEAQLKYDHYYEWNANINGIIIQLRTNLNHLYDFWVENWYPAQLEADIEPHGIIYAVDGAIGRDPYIFYHSESATAVIFNTDYYKSIRSVALGMVADLGQRAFDLHAVRAMTGDVAGIGFGLIGPKGAKKSNLFYRLMKHDEIAFHAPDLVFLRYGGGIAAADAPERKVYLPSNNVIYNGKLNDLLERSRCENVVTTREFCTNRNCGLEEECSLDKGAPYCFIGSDHAHVLFDPYWLGGMQKHVKRIDLRFLFLLRNTPSGETMKKIDADDAISWLESGTEGSDSGAQAYYNPHILVHTPERIEIEKQQYSKLLSVCETFAVNTGSASIETIDKLILEKMKSYNLTDRT